MIEAMKQALEALEDVPYMSNKDDYERFEKAQAALRQAIEQAEKQEPVATLWQHGETGRTRITMPDDITDFDARWFKAADLYTAPQPQREWVGLTPDEVFGIADQHPVEGFDPDIMAYTRAIEAKLKQKNNG